MARPIRRGMGAATEHLGRYAVERMVAGQRRVLRDYGVEFDVWSSEQRDVRDRGLPERVLGELAERGPQLRAGRRALVPLDAGRRGGERRQGSRAPALERRADVLRGRRRLSPLREVRAPPTASSTCSVPITTATSARMRAAMQALGHPPEAFEVLIVQLVTLLRDGQPVRMSKRRGEFVLMEELLEEVGRDAARFTFLTRRHDSPLDFDLAVATRQSSDNPVYYVQYAHAPDPARSRARRPSRGSRFPRWDDDRSRARSPSRTSRRSSSGCSSSPRSSRGAARALEPHRIAYWLQELAGLFHPYYKSHRVIQEDRRLMLARFALCAAVGQVVANGLELLGVSARRACDGARTTGSGSRARDDPGAGRHRRCARRDLRGRRVDGPPLAAADRARAAAGPGGRGDRQARGGRAKPGTQAPPALTFYQELTAPLTAPPPPPEAGQDRAAARPGRAAAPPEHRAHCARAGAGPSRARGAARIVARRRRGRPGRSRRPSTRTPGSRVQVAAYSARQPAETLRAMLAASGHDAKVVEADTRPRSPVPRAGRLFDRRGGGAGGAGAAGVRARAAVVRDHALSQARPGRVLITEAELRPAIAELGAGSPATTRARARSWSASSRARSCSWPISSAPRRST